MNYLFRLPQCWCIPAVQRSRITQSIMSATRTIKITLGGQLSDGCLCHHCPMYKYLNRRWRELTVSDRVVELDGGPEAYFHRPGVRQWWHVEDSQTITVEIVKADEDDKICV